ncbi:unnamed protein product [Alopecurus aequalis]
MASPAACAQYSSLVAALRVPTAPGRRPAPSFVHIPPAARTAPRSLSVSLSVSRPRARGGASDRESAGDDAGFGFSPSDPAGEEDPCDISATTDLSADVDADAGFALHAWPAEDPFELAITTCLREGVHDEADAGMVPGVPTVEEPHEVAPCVLHVWPVEDPFELAATTALREGAQDEADAGLVPRVPTVEEPHEVSALAPHVTAVELTATTDLCECEVARDDPGLVLRVPTVEEPIDVTATTVLDDGADDVDDGADDDSIAYPTRLTEKDLREFENMDFSRAAISERFRLESKEANAAVTGAVVGILSPLRELLHDLRSLDSVFDTQEFQIGMPFGAIMTFMGMYQLWKLSPSTCIDVAMSYAFYKLSVMAADVQRRGFSPDWIIRIQLGLIFALFTKEKCISRCAIFVMYGISVGWDVLGFKKYASSFLPMFLHVLITGVEEETTQDQPGENLISPEEVLPCENAL